MLQFDLSPLIGARSGERLVFSLDEGPQRLDDISVTFLRGSLQFTRVQGGILVEGKIETEIEAECVRCLEPFLLAATLDLEEIIALSKRPGVTYSVSDEGWFDASPLLREQAWVAIPIKALCASDCHGLCPECGSNLNQEQCNCPSERVDPRLEGLRSLLAKGQE